MSERNTVLRSMHDLGLGAWFGGSLMGAVGLNGAAEEEGMTEAATARTASAGWARWAPVNALAIGAHVIGGTGLLAANRARVQNQRGVAGSTVAKAALTGAALAATAYAGVLGRKVDLASSPNPEDTEKARKHPVDVAQAQKHLALVQWAIPALTAGLVVLNALHGEQQRPSQQAKGILLRAAHRNLHL
ncbi:hypothetical protein ACFWNI_33965 [Streptomyces sp. NPDC058377]|uniref:hypothetical protein n=1 Tax=Streptomyces sp. NPDC058377 TaxID=3346468 RepID=UPI003667CC33